MDLKAMAEQAVRIHRQGDLTNAEKLYLQILDTEPGLFGPRYYMGLIRLQQGRSSEAADYLGEALNISPDNLGARYNLGMALLDLKRAGEALAAFESVMAGGGQKRQTVQPSRRRAVESEAPGRGAGQP